MKLNRIFTLLFFVVSFSLFAQEEMNEGIVKLKMTMSSENEEVNAQLAMVGEVSIMTYFKGNKTRSETFSLMQGNTINIIDYDKKEMMTIMDSPMAGKKYTIAPVETEEQDVEGVNITKSDETKTLLGYECDKYTVTTTQDGVEIAMDIYVTDKLSAMSNQISKMGNKIKGFPLLMEMKANQMGMPINMTFEATEIKNESVSDDKFDMTPPEGYEKSENLKGM